MLLYYGSRLNRQAQRRLAIASLNKFGFTGLANSVILKHLHFGDVLIIKAKAMSNHWEKKLANMDEEDVQIYFHKKFGKNSNLIGFFHLLLKIDRQLHPELYQKIEPRKHD
jgi:hypothetical protein